MPKDTKTLGNNKTQACESLGFAHKKRGYVCFDTPSCFYRSKISNFKVINKISKLILNFQAYKYLLCSNPVQKTYYLRLVLQQKFL